MSDKELGEVRKAIDGIDGALIALFARRFDEVKKVTAIKHRHNLPAAVPSRVDAIITRVRADAEREGFPPAIAEKIWRLLINEMIAYEEAELKKG
jgi:isochorismate pyruvate lyase